MILNRKALMFGKMVKQTSTRNLPIINLMEVFMRTVLVFCMMEPGMTTIVTMKDISSAKKL